MRSNKIGLTEQQRAFAAALEGEGNHIVAAAAKIVGVHPSTAGAWLNLPAFQEYLAELQAAKAAVVTQQVGITAEDVFRELGYIAFSDITELLEEESFELVENGQAVKQITFRVRNPKTLPLSIRRAIARFKMIKGTHGNPPTFECQMYPKVEALKMIALAVRMIDAGGGSGDPENPVGNFIGKGVKLNGLTLTGPAKGKLQAEGVSSKANGHAKAR
jgi:hypothetical protein